MHSNPPRGALNDGVAFLWRWELAGHSRDEAAWRTLLDYAEGNFPRAGVAFSDLHIAVAHAVAGDGVTLAERALQAEELCPAEGRYPSGPMGSGGVAHPSPRSSAAISLPRSTRSNQSPTSSNASAAAARSST